jgi:hypothetical protein
VSKALAVGFVQAGQPKDAMAIYQALDMTNASAADYQSMVGAAIAVQNMKQAEAWLRDALAKFPNDPKVLASAAQFETARGDRAKAAEYWRASLNAMPAVSPSTNLAHKLDQPDLVKQTRPEKPTDLVNLLNPDGDVAGDGVGSGVPLPSFSNPNPTRASTEPLGPDPYYMGTAPVVINNGTAGQSAQGASELPAAPLTAPLTTPLPAPSNAGTSIAPITPMNGNPAPAGNSDGNVTGNGTGATPAKPGNPAPKPTKPAQPQVKPYIPQASVPAANAETQVSKANIPEQQPEQLGLETSPALTPLPNATDQATQQAEAALDAAKKPIDPSMVSTQYAPPSQQIQANPERPDYFEKPPAANGATDDELMRENLPPLRGSSERPAIVRQRDLRGSIR